MSAFPNKLWISSIIIAIGCIICTTRGYIRSIDLKQNTFKSTLKSTLRLVSSIHYTKEKTIQFHKTWEDFKVSPPEEDVLNPILISIEGNIGAGKTTLLEVLRKKHPEWRIISEPVDVWSEIVNDSGDSILEVFYKDRRRWSYTFQNCALITRFQNIEQRINEAKANSCKGKTVFLTERCLDTDYHVFTKMLREEGSIDKLELELYERLLNQLKATATPLSGIIHVETKPLICGERIKKRSRTGEDNIPMDYLESLHKHQCHWVDNIDLPTVPYKDQVDLEKVEKFVAEMLS